MNALKAALNALSSNQSGHWGIVSDVGVEPLIYSDERFHELQGDRLIACIKFQCGTGDVLLEDAKILQCDFSTIRERLNRLVLEATNNDGRRVARFVVTGFGTLSVNAQCAILRASRAVREMSSALTIQTLVIGAWNFFNLQEHWKKNYDDVSPAPDRKHVFFESGLAREAVWERLLKAGCVSHSPTLFEDVCVDALSEVAGGDCFLIDYTIEMLRAQRLRVEDFESVLSHVVEAGEVEDALILRTVRLGSRAWDILERIIRQQFVIRPERDLDVEDLRLAGLIAVKPTGTNRSLAVASTLIERILREKWRRVAPSRPAVYRGADLARPIVALNTAAYCIVSQIENTLRNLVVLALSQPGEIDWTQRLNGVKTLANEGGEVPTELLGLARQIFKSLQPFAEIQPSESVVVEADSKLNSVSVEKRPKQVTLIDAARNWRERQRSSTALALTHESLIYFFTTEGLASVLVNEKQQIYSTAVKSFFPNKHELTVLLEQYVAIRAAVAHNQPIGLVTLKRLETLRDDFEKRISQAEMSGGE